jgi:hypothetical protein
MKSHVARRRLEKSLARGQEVSEVGDLQLSGKGLRSGYHRSVPTWLFKSRFCERSKCPPLGREERARRGGLRSLIGLPPALFHVGNGTFAWELAAG